MDQTAQTDYWKFPGQHIYDGMVFSPAFPREALDQIKTFQLRSDDILLPNYPKSGTCWLGEIVWLICNTADTEKARSIPNRTRVPVIESVSPGTSGNLATLVSNPGQRIISTHLMPYFFEEELRRVQPKVIVIMRNPKDTLVSYYHFYQATSMLGRFSGSFHEFFQLFLGKQLNDGDYFDHVVQWWAYRENKNVLFLTYEDMKRDLEGNVRKIISFLGRSLTAGQIQNIVHYSSFDQMKSNPMTQLTTNKFYDSKISPYIRKGKVGDWKSYFTVEESEIMDGIAKEKLAGTGLQFEYEQ